MSYDKPKVTIDLDEYNNLQKRISMLQKQLDESDISMYKKAIYYALASAGRTDSFQHNCMRDGVSVVIKNARAYGNNAEEWEGIYVSKIEKKDAQ